MKRQVLGITILLGLFLVLTGCNDDNSSRQKAQKQPEFLQETTKSPRESVFTADYKDKWIALNENLVKKADDFLIMESKKAIHQKNTPGAGLTTGGVYVVVPRNIETQISGKQIRVTVLARKRQQASTEFAVAYSTDQVGNSGWHKFAPTTKYRPYSFTYNVPPMKKANKDYLGIWPDTAGSGKGIDVKEVYVEILN